VKNKTFIGATILMLAAKSVLGADNINNDQTPRDEGGLYRSGEFSVDAFGTASLGEYSLEHLTGRRVKHNTRLGAGVGLNYFFTQNFGVGAEVYSENTKGNFVDSGSANLILRLPLGQSGFAPYAFGGGGYQFDMVNALFAQVGAGMEYRFSRQVGLFVDARWVLPDETKYYGVARLGLRFAF
jgi:hypothetical protein